MTIETGSTNKPKGLMIAAGIGLVVAIGAAWFLWSRYQTPVTQVPAPASSAQTSTEEAAPQITAPNAKQQEDTPSASEASGFDVVRVDPDGSAVVAGHAKPDSTIQLTLDGQPLEDITVDSDGNFVALLDLPIETPGALGIAELDDSGRVIENSESPQTVLIAPMAAKPAPADTTAATTPTTEPEAVPETSDEDTTIAAAPQVLLADEQGIAVLQDGGGRPAVDNIVIDAITYDDVGDVALSGRGQSGADLRVYLDNTPIEIGEVSESGQWRVPLSTVPSGVYTLRVDELADDGSVASRTETPFKREEPAQLAAVANTQPTSPKVRVEAVTVQPGSTLWAIARDHLGEGPLYVRVFAANREQIRDPDLIYPGQVFAIPDAE
ncbi:LysM peptidoglycan-binding domain-containing protein [Aliiroseovarius sp. S1339]|uniref:LysM peptidoglycan-binding domain-containing protein n=1 Tax=Aliiroseovarius sp. S1339 TaxID=2936990 RepID=UPI0020C0F7D9|nr:LysM peptidoglycan-binding domain-containing protein [Aliiroseovarius sp. S1339]MCK8462622.1 LysM peptidoglycan-binding domain-containing protein [Aliiroseovarius sp. S1339]